MKKIDLVFFYESSNVYWDEKINSELNEIFKDLEVTLAKTIGYEVEVNLNGSQTIKALERPAFSNKGKGIDITFIDNRIDFKFILNENEDIADYLNRYFLYLEKIVSKYNLKIIRLGINCEQESNNKTFDLQKYFLPLQGENVIEFGIKQAYQEELINCNKKITMNTLTALQKTQNEGSFLLDFNTIFYENGIEKELRTMFLDKVGENINNLYLQLLKIARGEEK